MDMNLIVGIVAVGVGLFSLAGAFLDWDFFMNHQKAVLIVKMLGRNGARVFYGLFGTGLIVLGILLATGIVKNRDQGAAPTVASAAATILC